MGHAAAEMPKYRSHKEVWALQIKSVEIDGAGGAKLTPFNDAYASFSVSADYVQKHRPQAGGYFVQYADGYNSYSPAQAFEEGYTRLTPTPETPTPTMSATSAPSGMLAGGGADKVTDPPPGNTERGEATCGEATISAPSRPRPGNLRAVLDQMRSGDLAQEHQQRAAFIVTKGIEAVFHAATRAAMDRIHEEQRNINELVAGADKLAFTGVVKPEALDRLRAIEEHLGMIRKTIASFSSDRRFRDITIGEALKSDEKERMERMERQGQAKRAAEPVSVDIIPIDFAELSALIKDTFRR